MGDSFAFNSNGGVLGVTLTRAAGIVTVTNAASHPCYPGGKVTVAGCANLSDYAVEVPVQQYLSASSFTYVHGGPDGPIAAGAQSISVQWRGVQQSAGFFSHFNRLNNGGFKLVANGGISGAELSTVAAAVPVLVTPFSPDRCIFFGGYNDINAGRSVATTVASVVAAVNACPNAFWDIFTPFPFSAGAAADTAANLRKLHRYFAAYKEAFQGYPNVRIHDSMSLFGASTGYAATGMVKNSDKIHPSYLGFYTAAKYLTGLDQIAPTGPGLPTSALDTIGNDAASENFIDNPLMTGTGGAVTGVTGTFPSGVSGALGGTATGATSALVARADGFGNDWVTQYTPQDAACNLRASISLNTARLPSGGTIKSLVAKASVLGLGSANAGNLKSAQMVLVFIADGVTYQASVQEASGDSQTAAYVQQEDIVDREFVLRDIQIPVYTSLTLARLDFTTTHYGAGAQTTLKVGRVQGRVVP